MSVRDHEIQARQFEFDEKRNKLQNLKDLREHIESSLNRIMSGTSGGYSGGGSADDRCATLRRSIDDIDRQLEETQTALDAARSFLRETENVRDGYDRVPVAIGKGRGRGPVEHIRIVRAQRG